MSFIEQGLLILLVSHIIEVIVVWSGLQKVRKLLLLFSIVIGGFGVGILVVDRPRLFSVVLVAIHLYRSINLLRIYRPRMNDEHLKRSVRSTWLRFTALSFAVVGLWAGWEKYGVDMDGKFWLLLAGFLQLLVTGSVVVNTALNIRKSKYRRTEKYHTDSDLPTLSVLVPARNETEDLEACIKSIVANEYPKLEVLVLDDCSQDKTSLVIKKFAHDGVRFIKGEEPATNWLAKNQAYETLMQSASGEFVMFMGVDVRLGPLALKSLIAEMLNKNVDMISVLPNRIHGGWKECVVQPMRYFWEIAWPRWRINRPPVLSTCWVAKKESIAKLGGMKAVSRQIVPEAYFSRELNRSARYRFLRSSGDMLVQTIKPLAEQLDTAKRTRYPQMHRRPFNVFVVSMFEFGFLVGPYLVLAIGIVITDLQVVLLSALSVTMLTVANQAIISITDPKNWWLGFVNFPIEAVGDIGMMNYSMWQYEFGEVRWKGRNVCLPVMHVYPSLPKLED